jgi:hypothetical protein
LAVCGIAAAQDRSHGAPYDWSFRHVVATGDRAVLGKAPGTRDYRLFYAWYRRRNEIQRRNLQIQMPKWRHGPVIPVRKHTQQIDWSIALGASMADGTFPAKYNFDGANDVPTCSDFVVYGLNSAGTTGGQANLVGLTNLYSGSTPIAGMCNSNTGVYQTLADGSSGYAATIKFAYNGSTIGGSITNSVAMALTGLKVAYVESTGSVSAFHVVTLPSGTGTGTVSVATAPGKIVTLSSWSAGDSYSSVWVDYQNDIGYVGTDNGVLHKILNVFCSTAACIASPVSPTEVTTGAWPVTLSGAGAMTSPVQDANGVLYVAGATSGKLYAVTSSGTVTTSTQSFMTSSIVDAPFLDIDSSNATDALYWFANSQPATSSPSVRQPAVVQTNSALSTFNTYSLLLNGSTSWGGTTTVHAGTFDNAFYNTRVGNIWACGWWQDTIYGTNGNQQGIVRIGLSGTTVTEDTSKVYATTSPEWVAANVNTCAPLTEVLDSSSVDHIFVSNQTGLSNGSCGDHGSCLTGYTISSSGSTYSLTQTANYGLNRAGNYQVPYASYSSGIIVDNNVSPTSNTCGSSGASTCGQAASIYFTYGNYAVKLTQAELE